MKIRTFDIKTPEPYVPVYDGERGKKAMDPKYPAVVFHLLSMSYRDKKAWDAKVSLSVDVKTQEYHSNQDSLNEEIFLKYCERIENLQNHDGDPLIKAAQFLEYIEAEQHGVGIDCDIHKLYTEIINAIVNRSTLEKGLEKNFSTSSAIGTTNAPGEDIQDVTISPR